MVQENKSLRLVRTPAEAPAERRASGTFTLEQQRQIFRRMVVSSLDAGFLRYSRRQELLRTASRMGIAEFEACLLIAEAQFRSGEIDPLEAGELPAGGGAEEVARSLSVSMQLGLALMVAAAVDAAIVLWLL